MYSNEDQNRFSFDSAGVPLAVPKILKVSAGIDTFSIIMYLSLLYYSISRPNYEIKIKLLSTSEYSSSLLETSSWSYSMF